MRKAAAHAIGEIGSKEAVPHLREALKDEYSDVREAAEEALGKEGIGLSLTHISEPTRPY